MLPDLGPFTGRHDDPLHAELGHDLPATPARIGPQDIGGIDAGDRQSVDLAHPGGDGGVDGGGLGAIRGRVGGILDIGAGNVCPSAATTTAPTRKCE